VVVERDEDEDEPAARQRAPDALADGVGAEAGADALLVRRDDGRGQGARAEDELELARVFELLRRVLRAHGDGRLTTADAREDLRGALDRVVEDDREPLLHVGAGDLLEVRGARFVEPEDDVPAARRARALVGLRLRVADLIAGYLGLREQVVRVPADLVDRARLLVPLGEDAEADLVIARRVQRGDPLAEAVLRLLHRLVGLLDELGDGDGVRLVGADGLRLAGEADAGGLVGLLELLEEVRLVVDHLELETRGLADDLADLLEALLVLAGDLDDDVLVAHGDGGLAEAELVDAAADGVLRLVDRLVADAGLDLGADLEEDGAGVGARDADDLGGELRDGAVELAHVVHVLELQDQRRDVALLLLDDDLVADLIQLFAGRGLVALAEPVGRRQLAAHVVEVAIALVLDRLFDVDRVDEAEAAAEVEAGDQPEVDAVLDVRGAGHLAAGQTLEGRPDAEERAERDGGGETRLRAPREIDGVERANERPHHAERADRDHPEGVVVGRERRDGRAGGCRPPRIPVRARNDAAHDLEQREAAEHVQQDLVIHCALLRRCSWTSVDSASLRPLRFIRAPVTSLPAARPAWRRLRRCRGRRDSCGASSP
jgi:hypothetical protein